MPINSLGFVPDDAPVSAAHPYRIFYDDSDAAYPYKVADIESFQILDGYGAYAEAIAEVQFLASTHTSNTRKEN